jgi:hypothetical protein
MSSGGRTVLFALIGWLSLALLIGLAGWFRAASAPAVAATVWGLTAIALFACFGVQSIRSWAKNVDLRWIVSFHFVRLVAGIYFLIDLRKGILSADFARPAAIGDIAVALLAIAMLAAFRTRIEKPALMGWNVFGLADIVFVVVLALRVGSRDWLSMAPLRELPLSLLPAFVVPLIIASHILIFVRLTARGMVAPLK